MAADTPLAEPHSPIPINRLSLDTLIEIMAMLAPKDIIVLRRTSRFLSTASQNRIVWVQALRRICIEYGIFAPTFPIDNMSIDQLEHAATSPARFAALLRRGLLEDALQNPYQRVLSYGGDSNLESYILVPGGRFLLTALSDGDIELWDLGYMPNMLIEPEPIASMTAEYFYGVRSVRPTNDGLGIRLVTLQEIMSPNVQFDVFEIFPSSSDPTFQRTASLRLAVTPDIEASDLATYLKGDLFLCHHTDCIVAWDIVDNAWISWRIGAETQEIFACNEVIFAISNTSINVYQLPDLHPRVSEDVSVPDVFHTPLATLAHSLSYLYVSRSENCCWSSPKAATFNATRFDIVGTDLESDHFLAAAHYKMWQLVDVMNQRPSTSSLPLPLGRSDFGDNDFLETGAFKSIWTGPQEVLLFFVDSFASRVVANVLTIPTTSGIPVDVVTGTLRHVRADERNDYEICPFSGRVCMVATTDDYVDVRVLDYLRPIATRIQ